MGTEFNERQLIIPAVLFTIFIAAGVYLIFRLRQKGWITESLTGLAAAAIGGFLAVLAQWVYITPKQPVEIRFDVGNGVENPLWIGPAA